MAKQSIAQRNSSILGALNVGKTGQTDSSLKELTENELDKDQFLRSNLLRKLRSIEFFSLNETHIHLRRADWFEYVCWTPVVQASQ